MNRLKTLWAQTGGKLGILLCLGGFVALFLGWNGAASFDDVPAQFPYLISGGLVGLSLVVIGAAMMIVETNREGRAEMQATLKELRHAIEQLNPATGNGAAPSALRLPPGMDRMVLAGTSSYHRPDCHLVEGRDNARIFTPEEAEAENLTPCRICKPDTAPAQRRQLRSS